MNLSLRASTPLAATAAPLGGLRRFAPGRWRLRHRLFASHAFLLLLLLVLGLYGSNVSGGLAEALSTTADTSLARVRGADGIVVQVQSIATASRDLLLLDEARQIRRQRELITQAVSEIQRASKPFEGQTPEDPVRALRVQFEQALANFLKILDDSNPDDARAALVVQVRPAQKAYQERLLALSKTEFQSTVDVARAGQARAQRARWVSSLLIGLAAVLGTTAAVWITRSILGPVEQARQAAIAIAEGRLDQALPPRTDDEVGELLAGIERMQTQLRAVIDEVQSAADAVAQDADQILDSNGLLSDRNASAGARLQETAASIEEITRTLASSSEVAERAAALTLNARQSAESGGTSVQDLVATMQQISASSAKIRDIIGVIDALSFQTNLLALNAAVEAARAGEHGKGFAVVAAEVRGLASRSAQAANEVRGLIEHSAQQVALGNERAVEAGQRIGGVVSNVSEMADRIGDISRSSREQAASVRVVNDAMCELDRNTQQNTALVTELSGAARGLGGSAARLQSSVRYFKRADTGSLLA